MTYETDQLAELIDQKQDTLARLLEIGQKQFALAKDGEIAELLDVLAYKQRLIRELGTTERALDPFRNQEPDSRRWRNEEVRRRCADGIERCKRLLDAVMIQEHKSEDELRRRRDETALRLEEVRHAGKARGAYAAAPARPSQIDLSR
jgi:flagellar biosynthesis/type III secretory pathway chaperone